MRKVKFFTYKRTVSFMLALILVFLYINNLVLAFATVGGRNIELNYVYKDALGNYVHEGTIYNEDERQPENPTQSFFSLRGNEEIVAYKLVIANRSFSELEDYIENGGTVREMRFDQRPPATPSDATPSDATPSDATPSSATPSSSTPSSATPSNATPSDPNQEDFIIYDLGEEYVFKKSDIKLNIFDNGIFSGMRNIYVGLMPIVYEINALNVDINGDEYIYTISSNKNFILKYIYNGEEETETGRSSYVIRKRKTDRTSTIRFIMKYNDNIEFFDSRDRIIPALTISSEEDNPVTTEPTQPVQPQQNNREENVRENQVAGAGINKSENADSKFSFELRGISAGWNTFIPKWEFKNADGKKIYYKLWNKSIREDENTVRQILYSGENIPITVDGIYLLKVWWEDDSGNKYDESIKEIKIDRFSPKIEVSFNNTESGNYYNKERIAEIKITEGNFDASKVKISVKDEATGSIITPEYSFVNDKLLNIAKVSFNKSGRYSLSVEAYDASNKAAEAYKSEAFTIDFESPEVIIKGVENLSANKVVPDISIYFSDKNIDRNKSSIILKSMSSKTSYELKNKVKFIDGQYEIRDLGNIKDDTYMLFVDIYDLAGNNTNKKLVFSVNTEGATFAFKPSEIIGAYTNKSFRPRIEIWNTDEVSIISATINGVEESYKYTDRELVFDKEISKDGKYIFNLVVLDTAGNKTIMPTVELVLDRTEPVVVIDGIKDGEKIKEEADILISTLNNSDEIQKIELNGKEISDLKSTGIGAKKLKVAETGNYKLYVEAVDKAGNVGKKTIEFSIEGKEGKDSKTADTFGNNTTKMLILITGIVSIGIAGYFVVAKKINRK